MTPGVGRFSAVGWPVCSSDIAASSIVTNMPMEPDWIARFYHQRGKEEQHIKEGKQSINWTRLSCKGMAQNEVRLQFHARA